jgi:hypothetical protein
VIERRPAQPGATDRQVPVPPHEHVPH